MDALALLSDDDVSDNDGHADNPEPWAKRLRSDVDFAALQRAGYSTGEVEASAELSLQSSFNALQSKTKQLVPKGKPEAQLGCAGAPDALEIYNGSNAALPRPWLTLEDVKRHLQKDVNPRKLHAPTLLQAQVWPILAAGLDLLAIAKSGSGKVLGFLLPFACSCSEPVRPCHGPFTTGMYSPRVLIVTATREAADHIETEARRLSEIVNIRSLALYGGGQRSHQLGQLRERPDYVISTLGRLHDFLQTEKHWFSLQAVRVLVIDSAEALRKEVAVAPDAEIDIESHMRQGMSFCVSEIRRTVMEMESAKRQIAIFASAMVEAVGDLAHWILRRPVEVSLGPKDPLRVGNHVEQRLVAIAGDKVTNLVQILKEYHAPANLKNKVAVLARDVGTCESLQHHISALLASCQMQASVVQSSSSCKEILDAAPVIITTHEILRNFKIEGLTCIVNYEPPEDGHQYVEELELLTPFGPRGLAVSLLERGLDDRALGFIANVMRRSRQPVPGDLFDAYKQRCGRDLPPIDGKTLRYLDCRDERTPAEREQ